MASTKYPQVYAPDGKWVGTFYTDAIAKAWVKKQDDAGKFEITLRRPEIKARD